MSEILEDPMMWFVLAFLAGLILTVVFGLLSMAAHILAELALMVDRKIRSHYRNRHAIRRMREARREVAERIMEREELSR